MTQGRAYFQGLVRCGSVWACPVCAATIRGRRAEEVRQVYEWHREQQGGAVYMLTLTVRHALGHDLAAIRRGVADAWRLAQGGKQWRELRERAGIAGYVRALEVTHGAHGWHPHLHILLLMPEGMTERQVARLRERLSVRWQSGVSRALGDDFVPNDHLGCKLTPAHLADYITKLGLEVSDVGSKGGRRGNRTPWQIATDHAEQPAPGGKDALLWARYAAGMKGARMLTWSRGLRAAAGLGAELTDAEIVEAEEKALVTVYMLDAHEWRAVRDREPWKLLTAAERAGVQGIADALAAMLRAPP